VAYWIMPRLAEFGFQGSRALQVWYGDSTLAWSRFGGLRGLDRTFVAGVEYRYGHRDFAAALSREPLELFQRAGREATAGDYAKSDSLLDESQRSLHGYSGPFLGSIFLNRGVNAYNRGDRAAAESLWVRSGELGPETATYWVLGAALAMDRGERAVAVEAIRAALAQDPNDPDALRLAQRLLPTTR
jgi:tetratricopeptide (TPR) repeat protein